MLTWLARFHVDLVRAPGAEAVTCQEHERIFEAIASGDPDAAAQAMSLHLRRAHASYRRDGAQGPTPSSGAQP
jgi:DNA-binding FadR family transcriptional regulator